MLGAGLWFGLLQPGAMNGSRVFLLVAYMAVGVWYLYRAGIQIRDRQPAIAERTAGSMSGDGPSPPVGTSRVAEFFRSLTGNSRDTE